MLDHLQGGALTVEFVVATLSSCAAGLLFGPAATSNVVVRLISTVVMLVGGYAAISLFGHDDSAASYLKMATVLWLPHALMAFLPTFRRFSGIGGKSLPH
jgi:hypothetical protein